MISLFRPNKLRPTIISTEGDVVGEHPETTGRVARHKVVSGRLELRPICGSSVRDIDDSLGLDTSVVDCESWNRCRHGDPGSDVKASEICVCHLVGGGLADRHQHSIGVLLQSSKDRHVIAKVHEGGIADKTGLL